MNSDRAMSITDFYTHYNHALDAAVSIVHNKGGEQRNYNLHLHTCIFDRQNINKNMLACNQTPVDTHATVKPYYIFKGKLCVASVAQKLDGAERREHHLRSKLLLAAQLTTSEMVKLSLFSSSSL